MMSAIATNLFATFLIFGYGAAVESAHVFGYGALVDSAHVQCQSDHQCVSGFYCYEESHLCTQCLDCSNYKRKSSWRSCPKNPSDCGACVSGHEEEIWYEGKTREMCVPSTPNPLSHITAPGYSAAIIPGYVWAAVITTLFLPLAYYVFCRKTWRRDRGSIHHSIPHENPPPYRSMELSTLTNNSEELLEEDHVLQIGEQKDRLVQAVPFQQPNYMETELFSYDDLQETHSGEEIDTTLESTIQSPLNVELHDENTMPSEWAPEHDGNSQLMRAEVSSASEECEPVSKKRKSSNTSTDQEACSSQFNINLFINNNVTIHKQF